MAGLSRRRVAPGDSENMETFLIGKSRQIRIENLAIGYSALRDYLQLFHHSQSASCTMFHANLQPTSVDIRTSRFARSINVVDGVLNTDVEDAPLCAVIRSRSPRCCPVWPTTFASVFSVPVALSFLDCLHLEVLDLKKDNKLNHPPQAKTPIQRTNSVP